MLHTRVAARGRPSGTASVVREGASGRRRGKTKRERERGREIQSEKEDFFIARERGESERARTSERDGVKRRALEIWGGDRSGLRALHATLNASQPRPCLRSFARSPSPERPRDGCFERRSGDGDSRRSLARSLAIATVGCLALPRRLRKEIAAPKGHDGRGSAFSAIREVGAARLSKRRSHEADLYVTRQLNICLLSEAQRSARRTLAFWRTRE